LRRYIPDESIDLIYLDPPFNSKADYNILFKEATGEESTAQIRAFSDFWHWDAASRKTYDYLVGNEVDNRIATLADALYRLLGKNDMTAYLFMMTIRLAELHRVLKPTGTIFLHCDPTASHYLKIVMDAIFSPKNFRNEIIWKRTFAHSGANRCGPVHDDLLFYSKSDDYQWHPKPVEYSKTYLENFFKHTDSKGRRFRLQFLTGSGTRHGSSWKPWRGADPTKIGRHWAIPGYLRETFQVKNLPDVQAALDELDKMGRIFLPKEGVMPMLIQYKDDFGGSDLQDVWTDITPIPQHSPERLGYPTQKPLPLLERIIDACSNEGDWVMDPFCGCGTAVDAAEKLNRHWLGIDVTYLAINVIKRRMHDSYPTARFSVEGEPQELEAAKELAKDRYQFQWWALSLIGARPVGASLGSREGKKGADEGIDG
jgi:DNA modification methylase